jgi:selenocysteine-specific translation elongation factor
MKHLTIGIFHDADIGRELGKKGTQSDIILYNRKTDDGVYSFMEPVDDKFTIKSQIASEIDAAIISLEHLTKQTGETIVMLDSFNVSNGLILVPPYTDKDTINEIIENTSLQSFQIIEKNPITILEYLQQMKPKQSKKTEPIIIIDHLFRVKGVGEIILGVVKQGIVKKHDSLVLMPQNKKVIIRSIQMQDKDVDAAEIGSRVGCALKGVKTEEISRGSVICAEDSCIVTKKSTLHFNKNKFYHTDINNGMFHVSIGMQTVPVKLVEMSDDKIAIESEKEMVFSEEDVFLILDLNSKKSRIVGKGFHLN